MPLLLGRDDTDEQLNITAFEYNTALHAILCKFLPIISHFMHMLSCCIQSLGGAMLSVKQVLELYLGLHDMPSDTQQSELEWIARTPILDDLLSQLAPAASPDSQRNASHILSQAAQSYRSPIAQHFGSHQYMSKVFDLAFSPDVSVEVSTESTPK